MPYSADQLRYAADELFACVRALGSVFDDVARRATDATWTGSAADDLNSAVRICCGDVFIAQADLYSEINQLELEASAAELDPNRVTGPLLRW